ncbi:MAG: cation-translocating P-type ATPase [Bacillota bacterium]
MALPWHSLSPEDAARELETDPSRGLSSREAKKRLAVTGPNRISTYTRTGLASILLSQFRDPMVLTLLGATFISAAMGEAIDAAVIAIIVCLNAVLGTVQEYRAEKSLEALENYAPPTARVIRSGRREEVPRESVVPGDLIEIFPGMRVPADARVVQCKSLQVEEAALTGESLPVSKERDLICPAKTSLSDRKNMVFGGTLVVRGEGRALVVSTGMRTEMGKIARLVAGATSQETPLERRLESLGRIIIVGCLGVCALLVVLGLWWGRPFHEVFLTGVSLAVAAVPEGLPAVVTLSFALGVQRMAKRGAIVRKLEAIETLGSVTVIVTDKTGTLTKNRLEVSEIGIPARQGPDVKTVFSEANDHEVRDILEVALLASDARHTPGKDASAGEDPTEQAIVLGAVRAGIHVQSLDTRYPRLAEHPFSPEKRMMSVLVKTQKGALVCTKGAPGRIIPACTTEVRDGKKRPLTGEQRRAWEAWVEEAAGRGMRVLAVAGREETNGMLAGAEFSEGPLSLYGCLAMADTLREEGPRAVLISKRAGIRPILVTGDHLTTAESVARQAGILSPGERGTTGDSIDGLSDFALQSLVSRCSVFARVSPAQKIRIVKCLKRAGEVVAMTGDGVNDAPALKEAAVGVSMGLGGTDVAREASSVVLTDDNFSTVVKAVEEGRAIYDNVRKFIRYLLSCNIGEVITMLGATVLRLPMPLSPTELLWMNLITDGLPALALGMDPPLPDIMDRPPRDPSEGVFSRGLLRLIVSRGVYVGTVTLLIFLYMMRSGDVQLASTMAYATLVTVQLVAAFDCRSETRAVTEIGIFGNPLLVGASVLSWLMLFVTIHYRPVSMLFRTVPLSFAQWSVVFLASVFPDLYRSAFLRKKQHFGS